MTFLWDRCDVCGRARPTRTCWLYPDRNACPYCCLACPERAQCPNPVWFPNLVTRVERPRRQPARPQRVSEAARALEELLKRLEGG